MSGGFCAQRLWRGDGREWDLSWNRHLIILVRVVPQTLVVDLSLILNRTCHSLADLRANLSASCLILINGIICCNFTMTTISISFPRSSCWCVPWLHASICMFLVVHGKVFLDQLIAISIPSAYRESMVNRFFLFVLLLRSLLLNRFLFIDYLSLLIEHGQLIYQTLGDT